MANSVKKTQKEMFNEILKGYGLSDEHKAFLEGRIAQLDKKSTSKSDKPTATQKANAELKDKILAEMEEGKSYTISDMLKALPSCADLSNQKVSAVMKQMVEAGLVVRSEDKRKAYFSKA
jgi:predicted transcriptional regulator